MLNAPLIWVGYSHLWINGANAFVKICRYTAEVALAVHPTYPCPPFWSL